MAYRISLAPSLIRPPPKSVALPKMSAAQDPGPLSTSSHARSLNFAAQRPPNRRKLPVLLFDIMDTIVRDPFYQDVPRFFRMTFDELIEEKHPTSWIDFEMGLIDEVTSLCQNYLTFAYYMLRIQKELAAHFFKDGRPIDLEGLKSCMKDGYSFIDGIEDLLFSLKQNGYEMHALTNYPIWYKMVEEKLTISSYLPWTFCSCAVGKRKPDPKFYLEALERLELAPKDCIFVDDRWKNVEAASQLGIAGLQFKASGQLHEDLLRLGVGLKLE